MILKYFFVWCFLTSHVFSYSVDDSQRQPRQYLTYPRVLQQPLFQHGLPVGGYPALTWPVPPQKAKHVTPKPSFSSFIGNLYSYHTAAPVCKTVYKEQCSTEYQEVCENTYEQHCDGYGKCKSVPSKACKQVPQQRCKNVPVQECRGDCEPYSERACRNAAATLGLTFKTAGNFATKGCWGYLSQFTIFYGTGGTIEQKMRLLRDGHKYRPVGHDCNNPGIPPKIADAITCLQNKEKEAPDEKPSLRKKRAIPTVVPHTKPATIPIPNKFETIKCVPSQCASDPGGCKFCMTFVSDGGDTFTGCAGDISAQDFGLVQDTCTSEVSDATALGTSLGSGPITKICRCTGDLCNDGFSPEGSINRACNYNIECPGGSCVGGICSHDGCTIQGRPGDSSGRGTCQEHEICYPTGCGPHCVVQGRKALNSLNRGTCVEGLFCMPDGRCSEVQEYSSYHNRGCKGRNELWVGPLADVSVCESNCGKNNLCVSFEWHAGKRICQLSSSCTYELSHHTKDWDLYIRNRGIVMTIG